MGKPTGFLEYERMDGPVISEEKRIENFLEFHGMLPKEKQEEQASRCMDCGVPFCQAGQLISGMASGCPLHNLVPELNDLVYRGCFEQAYERLSMTHSFPEFTSRVCPALCEAACTCGLHGDAVSTKDNEKAVIEFAYEYGLVKEIAPKTRTGKKVAVVGSGPSGLAAAQLLNSRGHKVTVFERSDRVGGLLRYGIPNMKLDKSVIDRRVKLMEEAGIEFRTGVNVCGNVSAEELELEYDAIVLACGASNPRDINAPGRDTEGIYFAVDFLGKVTKSLLDSDFDILNCLKDKKAEKTGIINEVYGKDVIVIGGGDTGNDCVGTSIRLGCKSVTQLEMMPKAPDERLASNPWPEWPRVCKTDYGQEEAIYKFGHDPRIYQTTVKEFISQKVKDKNGKEVKKLKEVVIQSLEPKKDEKTGRMVMVPVEGSEKTIPADLVLIAAGFLGSESYVTEGFSLEVDPRTNVKTDAGKYRTVSKANSFKKGKHKALVYTAGDMHRGQSLVVWAISEGRNAAREVDRDLMGYSNL
ncbi:MAG: glutamate synthase subunit beta [Eubacterium sp.]|nr:glutamate synthase subunit beta [Eubacterium sp.]